MVKSKRVTPLDIFDQAIHNPDPDKLQELILKYCEEGREDKRQLENLHIDFKSAKFFSHRSQAYEIKKDIASFANSEGGVIVYGISENEGYEIEDCLSHSKISDPADKIRQAYQSLAPYIYPKPYTISLKIKNKTIIVVAIPRSETLVPILNQGSLSYFLRIGSSTGKYQVYEAPNYLVEDLISQRRNRPSFAVSLSKIDKSETNGYPCFDLKLNCLIENASFNWSENCILGIVYFQMSINAYQDIDDVLSQLMEMQMDINLHEHKKSDQPNKRLKELNLVMRSQEIQPPVPLAAAQRHVLGLNYIPYQSIELHKSVSNCKAAIFIMPKGYAPSWFQLELSMEEICQANPLYGVNRLIPLTQVVKPQVCIQLEE